MLLLSGCGSAKPFLEMGVAYQYDERSDQLVRTSLRDQCENPAFRGRLGLEYPSGWRVAINHYSWILCGTTNDKPEIYSNDIEVSYKFGGIKP